MTNTIPRPAPAEKTTEEALDETVHLATGAIEPNLARFNALAAPPGEMPWVRNEIDGDHPDWQGACPAWCVRAIEDPAHPHPVDIAEHHSTAITVIPHGARQHYVGDARVAFAHLEVAVVQRLWSSTPLIDLTQEAWRLPRAEEEWGAWTIARLFPARARELARALLAAADLADPDGEFEEAGA